MHITFLPDCSPLCTVQRHQGESGTGHTWLADEKWCIFRALMVVMSVELGIDDH